MQHNSKEQILEAMCTKCGINKLPCSKTVHTFGKHSSCLIILKYDDNSCSLITYMILQSLLMT
jgi:3-oxoacyl-[acyl-carrier-protein] synthase III